LQVDVVSVDNGQKAKDLVERETFDLVFMDASMPVLDGFQATRAIRAAEISAGRAPVPIVALTAHVVGSRANEWQDAGMVDCVTKPFTLAAIEACLRKWVPEDRLIARDASLSAADTASRTPQVALEERAAPTGPLPVLDPDVLQSIAELAGPASDLTTRLAALFREHAPIAMDRLRAAIDGQDITSIGSAAHAFKSMCRNIGAVELGQHLHEIEEAAAMQSSQLPPDVVDLLDRSLKATLAALDHPDAGRSGDGSLVAA
jgi:CheY-like chemotaxis protein